MKRLIISALFAAASLLAAAKVNYDVIPRPESVRLNADEKPYLLTSRTRIVCGEDLAGEAEFLRQYISEMTGISTEVKIGGRAGRNISLILDDAIKGDEAYRIKVSSKGVEIAGKTPAGVFYGVQTIRKSLPAEKLAKVEMPAAEIADAPRFAYRGGLLDVSRHFFSVEFVKKFIDILALHNINKFHWHLTDDQGWRIEIEKYPKLIEIGSTRPETMVGRHYKGIFDGIPHGGFYTKAQAREIVEYAASRHIEVIPEIDMPGHMVSALASYPQLGCTGGPYEVRKRWDIAEEVLCAGNDDTIRFAEDVLDEICDIFPSKYIHIGGDECPKNAWRDCPKCQTRIKELGLEHTDAASPEEALQGWYMRRMSEFLAQRGRRIIGWDEILEGENVGQDDIIMSWRGEEGGGAAAKKHIHSIMTPGKILYFNKYQTPEGNKREPHGFGGYIPMEKVYSYDPTGRMDPEFKKYVLGCQANLWTEFIASEEVALLMFLPRASALSEIAWTLPENKDYESFMTRIRKMVSIYELEGWNYARYIFE